MWVPTVWQRELHTFSALFYLILKKKKKSGKLEIISPISQKWENWELG